MYTERKQASTSPETMIHLQAAAEWFASPWSNKQGRNPRCIVTWASRIRLKKKKEKKKKGTFINAPAPDGDRLDYFKSCTAETRRSRAKKKKREESGCQLPLVIFHFFLSGALKVGYWCPTNPSSLSHHSRDVGHFQPPGPLPQIEGTSSVQRRWREEWSLVGINSVMWTLAVRIVSKYQMDGRESKSADRYYKVRS